MAFDYQMSVPGSPDSWAFFREAYYTSDIPGHWPPFHFWHLQPSSIFDKSFCCSFIQLKSCDCCVSEVGVMELGEAE